MRLTIHDLERETGLQRRTIHYYAHEGLLPSPDGSGPSATYREEHLLRLRLIPSLKAAGLRLDRICRALDQLRVEEMRRLVAAVPGDDLDDPHRVAAWLHDGRHPSAETRDRGRPEADRTPDGCRQWLRREVAPGVEIHFCAETARGDTEFETRLHQLDELLRDLFEDFGR